MRIISGKAKGRRLKVSKNPNIRATADIVKESLFNVIKDSIISASFLDLFAGTGSIGLEAFSRNAAKVVMVDKSKDAKKYIFKNIEICGFSEYVNSRIFYYHRDVLKLLDVLKKSDEKFNIIFLDPPYKNVQVYCDIFSFLAANNFLYHGGEIIAEHYAKNKLNDYYGDFKLVKSKVFGEKALSFYAA